MKTSKRLVNPVFYSYLGLGLKAARLATLGALETEGLPGYLCRVWDGEGDTGTQLIASFLGYDSGEERFMLS